MVCDAPEGLCEDIATPLFYDPQRHRQASVEARQATLTTEPPEEMPRDRPVGIAVYQSQALTDANGRAPEEELAKYLVASFQRHGVPAVVEYGYDPLDLPVERAVCHEAGEDAHKEMQARIDSGALPSVQKDSNIVLTNARGGGCAGVGGVAAAAGASGVTGTRPGTRSGSGSYYDGIHAPMHEISHNLGFPHDPHPGFGENNHRLMQWRRTPSVGGNDVENMCGEFVEAREYEETFKILDYTDCFVENAQVTEPTIDWEFPGGQEREDPRQAALPLFIAAGIGLAALRAYHEGQLPIGN